MACVVVLTMELGLLIAPGQLLEHLAKPPTTGLNMVIKLKLGAISMPATIVPPSLASNLPTLIQYQRLAPSLLAIVLLQLLQPGRGRHQPAHLEHQLDINTVIQTARAMILD